MRSLIWGFAGRTNHIVGNLMHWLINIFYVLVIKVLDFQGKKLSAYVLMTLLYKSTESSF